MAATMAESYTETRHKRKYGLSQDRNEHDALDRTHTRSKRQKRDTSNGQTKIYYNTRSSRQKPAFGHRILTSLIDSIALNQPEKLYAVFPKTTSFEGPLTRVTYSDLSRAINRASWWLEETLGGRGSGSQNIAWIGPNDLRYCVLAIAANKTGYTLLLPSPRNSVPFYVHIFNTTKCDTLLRDGSFDASAIKAEMELNDIVVPSLDWFLDPKPAVHYPYNQTSTSFDEKFLILHSSGSTGMPKCITFTHRTFATFDAVHNLPLTTASTPVVLSFPPGTLFNPFPMFHAAGMIMNLSFPVFYDHQLVLPPPGQLKAETLINAIQHVHVDVALVPSSVLEDLALDSRAKDVLGKIKGVMYGGGPLSEERIVNIAKHTRLVPLIATTESGLFPLVTHDSEDFNWFAFPPELKGIQFRRSVNDLYELFFVRDRETDPYHYTWNTFPELDECSTKDVYIKHPTIPGLWKHHGRIDDVVVLNNGEKVVAPPFEDILFGAPEVHGALLFGQGQFEIGALIQRTPQAQSLTNEDMIERLGPYISKGNTIMPDFAKLSQDRVIFTDPGKAMIRAPKGSIIRSQTIELYKNEINQLYSATPAVQHQTLSIFKADSTTAIQSLIEIYSQVMESKDIDKHTNVFDCGFDSLCVLKAVRKIKACLQAETNSEEISDFITSSLIYDNPSIQQLAKAIQRLGAQSNDHEALESRTNAIEHMFKKYANGIPEEKVAKSSSGTSGLAVVLTGSTGSLGAYILDSLIHSNQVTHVYALNRSDNAASRQKTIQSLRGLSTDFSKVTFFHADLSKKHLGLLPDDYDTIMSSTHLIIHNQWQVDFNLPLSSFEPHVAGTRNLIDLSIESTLHPYILFSSSVGATGSYSKVNPTATHIPEAIFEDSLVSLPIGYAESKHISERLLNIASSKTGIHTAVARLGQIAGPINKIGGVWNKQEWFPSMAISSAYLKLVPSELGTISKIDWLPVDVLADALVEISLADSQNGNNMGLNSSIVYNVINPGTTEWSDLVPTMLKHLPAGTRAVSMSEWSEALKQSGAGSQLDIVENPAVKLLNFYEGLSQDGAAMLRTHMVVKNALQSSSMQLLEPIRKEWLAKWLASWGLDTVL